MQTRFKLLFFLLFSYSLVAGEEELPTDIPVTAQENLPSSSINGSFLHYEGFGLKKYFKKRAPELTHPPTHAPLNVLRNLQTLAGIMPLSSGSKIIERWNDFTRQSDPNATYLEVASSWGTILARSTLEHCPKRLSNRIEVIALAPAGYIDKQSCARISHRSISRDPVMRIDASGSGPRRYDDTITYINSLLDAYQHVDPVLKHPTYAEFLKKGMADYLRRG